MPTEPTPADAWPAAVPHDLPEPVVPQFFREVREIPCPDRSRSRLPLTACVAAVLAGYTGRSDLRMGTRRFRPRPATTLRELAAEAASGGSEDEVRLGPGLTLQRSGRALTADYDTDRYSHHRVGRLLTDVRRVLSADPGTSVAELGINRLPESAGPTSEAAPAQGPAVLRGPVEHAVAEVWSQLLELVDVSQIDRDDNFFALGGHSLSAIRAANRLSRRLGVELPKQLIVTSPTPREAAAAIEAVRAAPRGADHAGPVPRPGTAPLAASPAQEAMWLFEQWRPGTSAYHAPWAIELTGPLDRERLRDGLRSVVTRHAVLRTAFHDRDGVPECVPVPGAEVPWTEHDLSTAETGAAQSLMAGVIAEPFDLTRAPLLRADLLRHSGERHTLLLTFHHLVLDGSSLEFLLRELAAGYDGRRLPELPLQYRDIADWQRGAVGSSRSAGAAAHWNRELAGVPALTELPGAARSGAADRAAPVTGTGTGTGECIELALGDGIARRVRELARQLGVTPYTVLFAAFQALLHRLTGHPDLVIGTTVTTRDHAACEGVIGPFFATVPVRAAVSGEAPFTELVRATQQRTAAAFAWKDVPLHTVRTGQGAGHQPPYRILFELSSPPRVPAPTGLGWSYRLLSPPSAKLDLIFGLTDDGEALDCVVTYATGSYDRKAAERLAGRYRQLLEAACAAPQLPPAAADLAAPDPDPAHAAAPAREAAPQHPARRTEDSGAVGGRYGDGPLQAVLARLWSEVLDIPAADIGPRSDFFALGGRSLDAVRLNSRLRRALRVTVPTAQLFRTADLGALTETIHRHATDPDALHRRATLVLTAWDLRPEERQALIERRTHA